MLSCRIPTPQGNPRKLFQGHWNTLEFHKIHKHPWKLLELCPSRPWDEGGHLDLLWFPITQMCVGVSVCVCARLCLCDISYRFLPMAFKFTNMVTMDKILNWLQFHAGHWASFLSKLTLFTHISYSVSPMAIKFSNAVTMDKTLNWLTFRNYGSIFQVTGGYYVLKLTLFTQYFLQFFASDFQILRYGDHGQDLELINFS